MPQLPRCPSCPYDGKAIASRGRVDSRLVLVGEAPGAREIECEEPFRGAAGRVLSGAIEAAGLHEEELLIVNAIACRPQPVRPTVAAIDSCRGRLMGELHEHPRAVVVTLGATPLRAVAEDKTPVLRAREGAPIRLGSWLIMPSVHPAWVLRWKTERFRLLVADLDRARRLSGL